ncbi:MAG: hypothetical protein KAS61_11850 [Spirochaetes bacterium]|nr:hypothetical protein [Spirochaetota bacterium]
MELPKIKVRDLSFSRLILGSNPITGYNHDAPELTREMIEYFTMENVKKLLRQCEDAGINAFQGRADRWIFHILKEYWAEGGTMQFICQTATEMKDIRANIRHAANAGACAVYHHGTETDNYWREGRINELREVMKTARECGVAVGVGSHTPEVIEYIEENDWDVDFYMTCFYNVYKNVKGRRESFIITGKYIKDCFDEEDRLRMCETIRSVDKPCIGFKILAAGKHCESHATRETAFRFAYENIKPTDALIVGMYPRHSDQVRENVSLAEKYGQLS